jgi:hypothetical protein
MLNLIAQGPQLRGKAVDGIIGSDLRRHVAQCVHQILKLMRGRRIRLHSDEIDFLRQNVDSLCVTGVILRRRQSGQRIAHFGKAVLNAGQSAAIGIGVLSLHDAVGQILNLLRNGFNGAMRDCLVKRAGNFMKFCTEGRDLFFHAGAPQRFDLVCNSAQLVLKGREVMRSVRRQSLSVRMSAPRNVGERRLRGRGRRRVGDYIGELIEPLFKTRRKLGQTVGFIAIPPGSVSGESAVCRLFDPRRRIIDPLVQIRRIIDFFHVIPDGRCLYALCCCLLQDDCIEPVAER